MERRNLGGVYAACVVADLTRWRAQRQEAASSFDRRESASGHDPVRVRPGQRFAGPRRPDSFLCSVPGSGICSLAPATPGHRLLRIVLFAVPPAVWIAATLAAGIVARA